MFACVLGFSFAAGALALAIVLAPKHAAPLLVVGIVGKGMFATLTLLFHASDGVSWPWLVFAGWDGVMVAVYFLYLIYEVQPKLRRLNTGEILPRLPRLPARPGQRQPRTGRDGGRSGKRALLLVYSLTGNSKRAMNEVCQGLEEAGYQCTVGEVRPKDETLFRFPFRSITQFLRIVVGAMLRRPCAIHVPQLLSHGHGYDSGAGDGGQDGYDLVVCSAQTWMLGVAAPVQALFENAETRRYFRGNDVAIVNVCRGLWRRPQVMLADMIADAGGRLVAAHAETNAGREPWRTLALFVYLATGGRFRLVGQRQQTLSQASLERLRQFGMQLGQRPAAAYTPVRDGAASAASAEWSWADSEIRVQQMLLSGGYRQEMR